MATTQDSESRPIQLANVTRGPVSQKEGPRSLCRANPHDRNGFSATILEQRTLTKRPGSGSYENSQPGQRHATSSASTRLKTETSCRSHHLFQKR